MIFAADLDRTLIFSSARLDPDGPPVVPVEHREGKAVGFMTTCALEAFRRLQRETVCFINTFRGLQQARRVSFVGDGSCPYLATQNGLALYRGCEEDREWSERVQRRVDELPATLPDAIGQALEGLPGIDCLSKRYTHLAVFFVNAEGFDDAACAQLAGELAGQGWSLRRQRKKLYLSPLGIDKGAVLGRVRELEGGMDAVGFGDSFFDLPMLLGCREAWAINGSELDTRPINGDQLKDVPINGNTLKAAYKAGVGLRFSSDPAQAGTEEVLLRILTSLGER